MKDKGKGRKVVDINREVILTEDLTKAEIAAIAAAEPSKRSRELGRRLRRVANDEGEQ